MNIGLIADDARKMLMQNLCIAYKGILSKNDLYTTGVTGRVIEEATNLHVHKFLSGTLGGEQQIATMIEQNQLDMVIFLRDVSKVSNYENLINKVIPLCDMYSIPLATNIATAEMLIKGISHGDLEWRNLYHKDSTEE
ncbi:MAG: methylglyoxal synthase [Lachnospiraceae bacterium]|nr:methylglyoxal synthase [Lachnospiraceae bacterium]